MIGGWDISLCSISFLLFDVGILLELSGYLNMCDSHNGPQVIK